MFTTIRRLALASTLLLSVAAPCLHAQQSPSDPLRVIRVSPSEAALPNAEVRVTFDRPVAGSLDYTVDPAKIATIAPAAPGSWRWRDPVTLVFEPSPLLRTGTTYTVAIDTTFTAMDGERLARRYTFAFRVTGPRLIGGTPISIGSTSEYIRTDQRFDLVWSAPVDSARIAATSYIETGAACRGGRQQIRMRVARPRRVTDNDSWSLRGARLVDGDETSDSLRRVVSLVPVSPLPPACAAELVVPVEVDAELSSGLARLTFSTYGPLALEKVQCGGYSEQTWCPNGPVLITFTNPVRGSEVRRKVKFIPDVRFTMSDTSGEQRSWLLDAAVKPRTRYAIVVDSSLRDVFDQRLSGNPAAGIATTAVAPAVDYPYGRMLVEREGFGTLAVRHVNVPALLVTAAPVPDSLEAEFLRNSVWSWGGLWRRIEPNAQRLRIPVRNETDRSTVTGIKLPSSAGALGRRGLLAVRITGERMPVSENDGDSRIALVQVTNLAAHVKLGASSGVVWVTRVNDGAAVAGATVRVHGLDGGVLAMGATDAQGVATFPRLASPRGEGEGGDGYVSVTLGDDRALVGVSQYDPDLSPWRFGVYGAWGTQRLPLAGAVFTERGIYRPGEPLYAKAIVRRGTMGSLTAPAAGDSVRWIFQDREGGELRNVAARLSAFGTSSQTFTLPRDMKLGTYRVVVQYKLGARWEEIDATSYRVAEYRPPEFLVDVTGPGGALFAGDSLVASVEARYLFGAPMSKAAVNWQAVRTPVYGWELEIPGLDPWDWYIGESGWWWDDEGDGEDGGSSVIESGTDTLDARGRARLRIALPTPPKGHAARVSLAASVTDVNRQVSGGATSVVVHPAEFYLAVKSLGTTWFWQAGKPQTVAVLAVTPGGEHLAGVKVQGTIVRREWHQVHRERDGAAEVIGEWVQDTVGRCSVSTVGQGGLCNFTPTKGGAYQVAFTASDRKGRPISSSLTRWVSGSDWVPWEDESRFKMDLIADKGRYDVGDTAMVMIASPFTNAEAWVTVEREGLIEQRRMRLTSGSTTIRIPVTEAFVPNAFVSVVVVRGRSGPPGRLDDPGRPTLRVGYTELKVAPSVKKLTVAVTPVSNEYRPGDSARVRLRVADARGTPRRAEVTLWAVDEGVLAMTGYKTPDPVELIYRARGLGMRLASNLVSVAPQIPEGEKGNRNPGGGGGADVADILRSRFKTTAFFLGSVVTDANGEAVATAKLPDNLTTFRVMAVAVTAGDRFGSGEAKLLVTRPVVARPALPRFLRPGDVFAAGTVVNRRSGAAGEVLVRALATRVDLRGPAEQRASLPEGRGVEVRFPFQAPPINAGDRGDTASFRFTVTSGSDIDAVETRLPFRPDYHPRSYTATGVLDDTALVELVVPKGIDPARSRLQVNVGGSVLAIIRGAYDELRVYPYYCTEQVTSHGRPLLALYKASKVAGNEKVAPKTAKADLELAVQMLSDRQRDDGGIGYWGPEQWTSPWLSSYAGTFLLDARAAGIAVRKEVIERLGEYLRASLTREAAPGTPLVGWYRDDKVRLADKVAIVDYLSRTGKPHLATENQLLAQAAQLSWEDRSRLAEVLARRGATREGATLLASQWSKVQIEGRRAVLPPEAEHGYYFESSVRPAARLLQATLAIAPQHPLVGPLLSTVTQQGRATSQWNTQDWASAVDALSAFERRRTATTGTITIRSGSRTLLEAALGAAGARDTSMSLEGLLESAPNGAQAVRLRIGGTGGGAAAFYSVTVREVPLQRPVRPDDHGVQLERWYERYEDGKPITSAIEGELVRVRLRIRVPAERQFLVVDDPLPAGLEAVDLSLRTTAALPGVGGTVPATDEEGNESEQEGDWWGYGRWELGWWSPFDYRELRDDRVVYFATRIWRGSYTATYVARATTQGTFVRPPAHAEEMYNPAVFGRSDGGIFTVTKKQ